MIASTVMNIQILQSSQWQPSADHVRKPHRETSKSDANVRQRFFHLGEMVALKRSGREEDAVCSAR
jgi:hypothetical protein